MLVVYKKNFYSKYVEKLYSGAKFKYNNKS